MQVGAGWRSREVCVQEAISYNHPVATHGDHRPVPPQFGEYRWAEACSLQTCMRCLAMFRRQYYLMHGSVRGPMVRLL